MGKGLSERNEMLLANDREVRVVYESKIKVRCCFFSGALPRVST